MLRNRSFCADCKQDLIRDCAETLHLTQPCLVRTMKRLAAAANYVGIGSEQLIGMLKNGASVSEVLDVIEARLEAKECGKGLVA
jgi:hypothetical protein